MAAAIFEAALTAEQASDLALLIGKDGTSRPAGVTTVALLYDGDRGQLVAIWKSRDALEQYIAETEVMRGRELMRKVGVEPTMSIVDVLEFG
ncbi:MAG: hypothetical protein EXQ81_11510 [Thermoleophilia bacterium]|nr:hypothetical protein [Thermoleophilia bacterium]